MIRAAVHFDSDGFELNAEFSTDAPITGVFGPSGAGKTTLMNLIAGLERPSRGSIVVDGETLYDSASDIDVPAHQRRIGFVFQEHRLFPHMSVRSNLIYGRPRRREDRNDVQVRQIIDLLELEPLLARRVTKISGGERQRIALGRALISRPRLLLLDEPLSSLDERLKQQIIPYLQRVRDASAIPILYVSHDLGEILQLTDRLVILERGRVVGCGRYHDLVHDDAVLPVIHDRGMRNVLAGVLVAHQVDEGTSVVHLGAMDDPSRRLIVRRCGGAAGAKVMLAIQPWDVALATDTVHSVSIRNQIRGVVRRCTLHDTGAIVEVDIGAPLIVEVSRRSAENLQIVQGRIITCLIKSNAIAVLDTA